MGTQPPRLKGGESPSPIFGPFLLWPNGWMHQDSTSFGGRRQPRRLCVRLGPSPFPKKGAEPPIFRPCLLRPNGCIDQDATWYGGRSRPRRHCVIWGPSNPSPKRGPSPLPNLWPMSFEPKRLDGSRWHLTWRWTLVQAGHIVVDHSSPPQKTGG